MSPQQTCKWALACSGPMGLIAASVVEIRAEIRRRLALCGKPDLAPLVVPSRHTVAAWEVDFTGIPDSDLELCLLIVTAVQRSFALSPAPHQPTAPSGAETSPL